MKKLIIICEGQTEQSFCKKILKEHLNQFDIDIEYPLISHSDGGIVKWIHLKTQIESTLTINPEYYVTTFIDYYGMEYHHDFPDWNITLSQPVKSDRMDTLEAGMLNDITESMKPKFIPFVQLHEFEALVFSDYDKFEDYYEPREANFNALNIICNDNPNPETINDSPLTAPSKRLSNNIRRYDKIDHGVDICELIGLVTMRTKSPRFNKWIDNLENI
jgi:hypothetical protein